MALTQEEILAELAEIVEEVAGVDKDAWVPEFAPRKFRPNAAPSKPRTRGAGSRSRHPVERNLRQVSVTAPHLNS